jgi:hypothetical protein
MEIEMLKKDIEFLKEEIQVRKIENAKNKN